MKKILGNVDKLYEVRFNSQEKKSKEKLWQVLCNDFIQKYVKKNGVTLDLAAGYCEFINNIKSSKKIAVDINPQTKDYANKDVKIIAAYSTKLPNNLKNSVDTVFTGCFLEHLPSKDDVFKTFQEVLKVLKPGGRFIILNPNIRFSTSDYWDFFDHLTPVSDRSVAEGLELAGFELEKVIPKFVPNTTKDKLPKSPFLLKIYLQIPLLFHIFGRQMFIVARKPK